MDLINYIGSKVRIVLANKYYYVGKVINADNDTIDILDIKGNRVSLNKLIIYSIQEVSE